MGTETEIDVEGQTEPPICGLKSSHDKPALVAAAANTSAAAPNTNTNPPSPSSTPETLTASASGLTAPGKTNNVNDNNNTGHLQVPTAGVSEKKHSNASFSGTFDSVGTTTTTGSSAAQAHTLSVPEVSALLSTDPEYVFPLRHFIILDLIASCIFTPLILPLFYTSRQIEKKEKTKRPKPYYAMTLQKTRLTYAEMASPQMRQAGVSPSMAPTRLRVLRAYRFGRFS